MKVEGWKGAAEPVMPPGGLTPDMLGAGLRASVSARMARTSASMERPSRATRTRRPSFTHASRLRIGSVLMSGPASSMLALYALLAIRVT